MNFLHDLLSEQILHALGWTLVHSLWQGALIALITGFLLLGWKKRSAKIRYVLAVCSLAAILLLSASTFIRYYSGNPDVDRSGITATNSSTTIGNQVDNETNSYQQDEVMAEEAGIKILYTKFADYFNRHFPVLITLWFMGLLFFLLKLMGGLIYSERIKHSGIKPFPGTWNSTINTLKEKMNFKRPVKVVESYFARVPMVIGYFKPVILMPLGILSGIPADQVEAIIAHELAHIRRNDFLVNIFQSVVEAIFFYHPAVWWISGLIRNEREHCCDDLAVSVCDESLVYAKALANLQERVIGAPYYAVAFAGRKHNLLTRIKRLNQKPAMKNNISEKWITLSAMVVIILVLSTVLRIPGINTAEAAVNPNEEMAMDMLNLAPVPTPVGVSPVELQDTLKKSGTKSINTTFFDASDQKEKQVRMIFQGDKVIELYIDGEKIPEDQIGNYQELIDNTLAELKKAEIEIEKAAEELKEAERSLAEIDMEQVQKDMESAREDVERAMQEMKEIDMEEMAREIDLAKEEFKRAQEQIKEIDMEELKNQYRQMEKELQESFEEFREEDWAKYKEEIIRAQHQMQEAMSQIELPDLHEMYEQMAQDMEKFWHEFDTSKINQELQQSYLEINREMKQFNQQYMQELRLEMEEARREIQQSIQELNQVQRSDREEIRDQHERQREMQRAEAEELRRQHEQQRETTERLERVERERIQKSEEREIARRERELRDNERVVNQAMRAIEEQLISDGFYEEGDEVNFELSAKGLKIDGKNQPKKVFEKYKKIYEDQTGSFPETGTVMIKR